MKKLNLVFLLLAFACSNVFAQSLQCGELQVKEASPSEMDCFSYEFPFYMKLKDFSPTPTEFTTCDLLIQGHMEGGTINEGLSLSQVHPNLAGGTLTFSGNTFEYVYDDNGQNNLIVPLGENVNLLTLTVEGMPGEHLNLVIDNVVFYIECGGVQCNFDANDIIDHSGITMPQAPSCTNSDWEVALGDEIIDADLVRIPVVLNSNAGLSLSEIDFAFSVSDINGIIDLDVQASLDSYTGPGTLEYNNGTFYFHDVSVANSTLFFPNETVLFEIWLTSYAGTSVDVAFDFARMKDYNTGECCAPLIVNPSVIIPGNPPCATEVIYRVSEPENVGECQVRYVVSLVETQSLFNVLIMNMELEVNLSPGISISSVNTLYCPGSCPLFGNLSDCLEVNGTTIEYGFCQGGGQLITGGRQFFEIILEGDVDECVDGIVFNSAEMTLVGEDNCTPNVEEAGEFCLMGVAGEVLNHCGDVPLSDVTIRATPDNNTCSNHQTSTDMNGTYSICTCNEEGTTYHVVPSKDDEHLCGVSTLDLILIQRHILGLEPLEGPYNLIAADTNCDDDINGLDLVELRKLVLGIYSELPQCNSWDFVDAAYVFPNPQDPNNPPYPDYVDVVLPDSEADFVGIKIGDVNCSSEDCGSGATGGNSGVIEVVCDVTTVKQGEEFVLPFKGNGFNPMVAYQMGIHFNPDLLKLVEVLPGNVPNVSTDNFGLDQAEQGDVRTNWLSENGKSGIIGEGAVLFYIRFVALQNIPELSSVITLENEIIRCEAYTPTTRTFGINLRFTEGDGRGKGKERSGQIESTDMGLSVHPNPISGSDVYFTFELPQTSHTSLRIYDLLGRLVYQEIKERPAGFQQIMVDELGQWTTGIYTYRFETNQQIQTGKIVKQ